VRPAQLRGHLETLVDRGYRATTFYAAVRGRQHPHTFVVTFDDAYRSVLELGYPVLRALRIPATVFFVTDFADPGRRLGCPASTGGSTASAPGSPTGSAGTSCGDSPTRTGRSAPTQRPTPT
jgi:hypothetical protein